MPSYNYIIVGAGASGLLLADALGRDSFFSDKSILLIEKKSKDQNDRTWCFWEPGTGQFDDILHTSWPNIHFAGKEIDIRPSIRPYQYKMVKGLDFYQTYLEKIKMHPNIEFIDEEVVAIADEKDWVSVKGKQNSYRTGHVFDSRFDYKALKQQSSYPVLQQHFLGWFVKTEKPVFDTQTASFMDFSIPQKGNTRFMYVLPFSETEALVEYTLFSEHTLEKSEYEGAIENYIKGKLNIENFEITEVEVGNIPMTSFDFSKGNSNRVLKIGIVGGWAKPSTGFTFYRSFKKVKKLTTYLKTGRPLSKFERKSRFWFYDLLFLDVLYQNNSLGNQVFESLFKKRSPQLILKFLDEETTFWEEFIVIWACPKGPFIKALFKRIFKIPTLRGQGDVY